ncbi:hypothetical protein T01_3768 [Trichinella spiralis]|uniref:Uncharacterized protein n=1 Tax=Trichinella spiralis TaxID=6334 RepID=A0A0V1C2Q4_TRISP|nr:hypothetical protein T01_3768 [Trichinella spiralis]
MKAQVQSGKKRGQRMDRQVRKKPTDIRHDGLCLSRQEEIRLICENLMKAREERTKNIGNISQLSFITIDNITTNVVHLDFTCPVHLEHCLTTHRLGKTIWDMFDS